jgi:hypothetical protein
MASVSRAAVVPSLVALFPALWYVNRNVTTAALPPRVEPTSGTVVLAVAVASALAAAVGAAAAPIARRLHEGSSDRLSRALVPNDRTLFVACGLLSGVAAYALSAIAGVGPAWLATLSLPVAALVGLPFLLFVPVSLEASPVTHAGAVAGLAASALWLAVLATYVVDALDRFGDRSPGG